MGTVNCLFLLSLQVSCHCGRAQRRGIASQQHAAVCDACSQCAPEQRHGAQRNCGGDQHRATQPGTCKWRHLVSMSSCWVVPALWYGVAAVGEVQESRFWFLSAGSRCCPDAQQTRRGWLVCCHKFSLDLNVPLLPCRAAYDVTVCPVSGPQPACVTQRVSSAGRRRLLAISTATVTGRSPDTT